MTFCEEKALTRKKLIFKTIDSFKVALLSQERIILLSTKFKLLFKYKVKPSYEVPMLDRFFNPLPFKICGSTVRAFSSRNVTYFNIAIENTFLK